MHEFSVTSWIVEALLKVAKERESKKVLEVHLRIGKLRALSVDQVKFCYEVLAKGTILDGSRLVIEESPGKVRCNSGDYYGEFNPEGDAFHFGLPPLICPVCSGMVTVEGGDECTITKVRMRIPSVPATYAPAS